MKKAKNSVLLTRSIEENAKIKEILKDSPIQIIECPLIHYQLSSVDWDRLKLYDYVIVTSKFLAKCFPVNNNLNLKIFVVGKVSASILQEKGYKIELCTENASQIKNYLNQQETLRAKNIIYFCGNYISTIMPNFVEQYEAYKVSYQHDLTADQIASFKMPIAYIMIYSENCAKTLLRIIVKYNLQGYLNNTIIISISDKVDKILNPLCTKIVIRSTNEQMISYLKANI
ncbi:MAG: uroporphyrinogen-III synthase [Rickettsiaceae bacterium]|nr:uroporphyrinogen-III synthase [Rickettsiaceae bacterium]